MKKVLTIILASLLNIQNTGVMASDAFEVGGEDNIASTKTLQDRDKINEILSYLPLKEIVRDRLVSKDWNDWIQQSIKHLIPHATWEDIQSFLKSPELKIPFYYAPKNARRNMDQFSFAPGYWELAFSLLKDKKHALQDQQLFIQNSLLNPEAITFLGKTPELMVEIKIEEKTRNIITEHSQFLNSLRDMAPKNMYEYVSGQSNISFETLGVLFVAMNKNVDDWDRISAAEILDEFGEEYRPQAAEAYLSIATDTGVYSQDRIKVAQTLDGFGEEYRPQATQAYLSIATDTDVYHYDRTCAADVLERLGEEYRTQVAEVYLDIAIDTNISTDDYRVGAAQYLVTFGEKYKPQAAEVFLDIATDPSSGGCGYCYDRIDDRIDAADALAGLGEEYKPQATKACRSILETPGISEEIRHKVEEILRALGEDE